MLVSVFLRKKFIELVNKSLIIYCFKNIGLSTTALNLLCDCERFYNFIAKCNIKQCFDQEVYSVTKLLFKLNN